MKKRPSAINLVALVLFVNLLTNAVAWTFVFMHELDHHHTSLTQVENIEHHQHNKIADDEILDSIIHLSLHAVGQHQFFYFTISPSLSAVTGKEAVVAFIPLFIPDSIRDSPFRPPRNISVS
ncbi:hypothetical protein SAMN05216419_100834 [Nitrosomonas cryotolerans]|uniref:Uncharacterized protein n=2 Tax=Nitrosomonas cryotolerans TaxID=44575 RepID=A0A1N6I2W4_9PROT|nr:hypothetical protein [Nitrosomonas cryotolerans]SFP59066.1 hypothetical protein SAMN05216419_100834 [Nitrosomonas cryotolerans]SIO26329.1 hypothetical protein SAMN02743940_1507 [Nitrosomonas cryotolerans ATCC 49181]